MLAGPVFQSLAFGDGEIEIAVGVLPPVATASNAGHSASAHVWIAAMSASKPLAGMSCGGIEGFPLPICAIAKIAQRTPRINTRFMMFQRFPEHKN